MHYIYPMYSSTISTHNIYQPYLPTISTKHIHQSYPPVISTKHNYISANYYMQQASTKHIQPQYQPSISLYEKYIPQPYLPPHHIYQPYTHKVYLLTTPSNHFHLGYQYTDLTLKPYQQRYPSYINNIPLEFATMYCNILPICTYIHNTYSLARP